MTQRGEHASGPWSGRVDSADGARGRRWHQVVRSDADSDRPGTALLGFASDAGVNRNHGRTGAAEGPVVLRRALSNLAWHGGDDERHYDAGNVTCTGDRLEDAQSAYTGRLAALLRDGHFPIGLGGGHEIAWAAYQGIERALEGDPRLERLGILNFDAHLGLPQGWRHGHGRQCLWPKRWRGRAALDEPERAAALGLKPLARVVASAAAGVPPRTMGLGPVPAVRKVLSRAGLSLEDIRLVELNEAFAVQALAVMSELGLDPAITNVNGGAIALGHPLGCSGARLITTLVHEMKRRAPDEQRPFYGMAALWVGVGQGEATIAEWVGD